VSSEQPVYPALVAGLTALSKNTLMADDRLPTNSKSMSLQGSWPTVRRTIHGAGKTFNPYFPALRVLLSLSHARHLDGDFLAVEAGLDGLPRMDMPGAKASPQGRDFGRTF